MTESVLEQAQRKRDYAEYVELVRKGRECTPQERARLRELRNLLPKSKSPVKPKE